MLRDAQQLAMRLTGKDNMGIVPRSVLPWYCEDYFPNEKILDFINLPNESETTIVKATQWKPVESFSLVCQDVKLY